MLCYLDVRCYFEADGQFRLLQVLKNNMADIFSLSHHLLASWALALKFNPQVNNIHEKITQFCVAEKGVQ